MEVYNQETKKLIAKYFVIQESAFGVFITSRIVKSYTDEDGVEHTQFTSLARDKELKTYWERCQLNGTYNECFGAEEFMGILEALVTDGELEKRDGDYVLQGDMLAKYNDTAKIGANRARQTMLGLPSKTV